MRTSPVQGIVAGDEVRIADPYAGLAAQIARLIATGNWKALISGTLDPTSQDLWARALNPIMDVQPTSDKENSQCVAEGSALAADDFKAMKTLPKARTIIGGAVVGGGIVKLITHSNPWALLSAIGSAFKDNIGGAIVGSFKFTMAYNGCVVKNGSAPPSQFQF